MWGQDMLISNVDACISKAKQIDATGFNFNMYSGACHFKTCSDGQLSTKIDYLWGHYYVMYSTVLHCTIDDLTPTNCLTSPDALTVNNDLTTPDDLATTNGLAITDGLTTNKGQIFTPIVV